MRINIASTAEQDSAGLSLPNACCQQMLQRDELDCLLIRCPVLIHVQTPRSCCYIGQCEQEIVIILKGHRNFGKRHLARLC